MGVGSTLQFTPINSFAHRLLLFPEVSSLVESNSTWIRSLSALLPGTFSDPEALDFPQSTASSPQGEGWDKGKDEEDGCLPPAPALLGSHLTIQPSAVFPSNLGPPWGLVGSASLSAPNSAFKRAGQGLPPLNRDNWPASRCAI